MSAIFVHDESQKQLALETKARQEAMRQGKIFKGKIFTQFFPASDFYLAEDYHQKYYLQNSPGLWNEISRIYPDPVGWINSTAAARLNGYVGRYGSIANLEADLARLGLSPAGQEELQKVVNRFGK